MCISSKLLLCSTLILYTVSYSSRTLAARPVAMAVVLYTYSNSGATMLVTLSTPAHLLYVVYIVTAVVVINWIVSKGARR